MMSPVPMLRFLTMLLLSLALVVRPATAQAVLRDAETEALLNDLAAPLVEAAGLRPGNVKIVLLQDPSINAFVAGGQAVYVHSGLIVAADNVGEVQGVIAHEIGHITGGHIIRFNEGAAPATRITLLSLLLGAAAMAAGAGAAGMAVMSAGQQMAMSQFLAFSRNQESSADAAGQSFLNKAGVSGKGAVSFFQKLRKQEYRLSSSYADVDPYAQTHPMSGDRAATLESGFRASGNWDKPTDPALAARFERVKAKLMGFVDEPPVTMRNFPESNQSIGARYARAYAWHRGAYPERAVQEIETLVASAPDDPYFLELKGQVLLESGKPAEAIAPLREATARTNSPLIASVFGHALLATEDQRNFAEAKRVLRLAVQRDNENPFAWYQLGMIYAREGDVARANLASAERYSLQGENKLAAGAADTALKGLPANSSDWLRADDISRTAKDAMERDRKRR